MDHEYIDRFDLIDRYVMGKLPVEEIANFEEHFVDCPKCIDRLKTTQNFVQDLQHQTVEQVLQADSHMPQVGGGFLSQIASVKSLALAVCCLLLAGIVGIIVAVRQREQLKFEINEARNASTKWKDLYEGEQQTNSLSEKEYQKTEQKLTAQIRDLEAELKEEQKSRSDIHSETGGRMRPLINFPIFVLGSVRGSEPNLADPVNEITLPRSPVNFVISLPLADEVKYKDYRVTILNDNRAIWKERGHKSDRFNSLSIGFNSRFFQSGNYLLTVEGMKEEGGFTPISNYPFRIIKNR